MLRGVELPARYELIRRIASGGMASVWCARDRTLERPVAIKLLSEPYAHDEVAVQRFKREALAAARMSGHRNVVTIYDVGQAAPSESMTLRRPFIVMEYLAGGTVADALRVGEVDRPRAVHWLYEAAAALDHAHGRGVIHRDVKPSNFLLDGDRVLHVADFGIAKLGTEDTLTGTGEVFGTAAYLAPERALGHRATEASDRYALAVAAFELLVGERPFSAENFTALARQHIEEPPPRASRRNPEVPRALDGVLARGMAKRPEQRFASAGELATAVDRALGGRRRPAATANWAVFARAANRPAFPRASALGSSSLWRRSGALAALAAAALGVGIAAGADHSGTAGHAPAGTRLRTLATLSHARAGHPRPGSRPTPGRPAATTSTSAPASATAAARTTPATIPAPTTPSAPAPPPSAGALEAQGHDLMEGGNYNSAIPVLRQAVATASPASLTYAYALFDLGRSLRLVGDPRAAVPILWQRLQIPNQTGVVRTELTLALRALGQQVSGPGAAAGGPPPNPRGPGHGAHA